MLHRL